MSKLLSLLVVVFADISALGQVNFPDETEGKTYKIEYRAFAGND